jgi:hypothetical protein
VAISFVLLWWHIPWALVLIGSILLLLGTRSRLGAFGWPTTELTGFGIIGVILWVIGFVLFIGGAYRGLF